MTMRWTIVYIYDEGKKGNEQIIYFFKNFLKISTSQITLIHIILTIPRTLIPLIWWIATLILDAPISKRCKYLYYDTQLRIVTCKHVSFYLRLGLLLLPLEKNSQNARKFLACLTVSQSTPGMHQTNQ